MALRLLGNGAYEAFPSFRDTLYGKVRHARQRATGLVVVIKEYDQRRVREQVTREGFPIAEDAREEIRIHAQLMQVRHPYIVEMYDVFEDNDKFYVVLQFCEKGDFFWVCGITVFFSSSRAPLLSATR